MEELRLSNNAYSVRGMGTMPYPPTPIEAVMSYLHSSRLNIEAKRTVFHLLKIEVANENLERLTQKLQQIETLENGWDGEDALPVNPDILEFVRHLFNRCKPSDLADWMLFPNVNGTVLLQKENAGISIGKEEFSFFAETEDEDIGEDNVPLSIDAVKSIIKQINLYAAE